MWYIPAEDEDDAHGEHADADGDEADEDDVVAAEDDGRGHRGVSGARPSALHLRMASD